MTKVSVGRGSQVTGRRPSSIKISEEGAFKASQPEINFTGDVTVTNDATNNKVDVSVNPLITTNRQTDSYTLVLTDADKLIEMNKATANTLTVPPNSAVAFPIGTAILVTQYGAGATTIAAGSGVTIRSAAGALGLSAQYAGASLIKIATNEWYLNGSIA